MVVVAVTAGGADAGVVGVVGVVGVDGAAGGVVTVVGAGDVDVVDVVVGAAGVVGAVGVSPLVAVVGSWVVSVVTSVTCSGEVGASAFRGGVAGGAVAATGTTVLAVCGAVGTGTLDLSGRWWAR